MGIQSRFECGINTAVGRLKRGQIIVYPTDTCYGIGGDAEDEIVARRLFLIKNNPDTKPISILVLNVEMAEKYVILSKVARRILENNSRGILQIPLTLILPLRENVPTGIKILSAKMGSLGIRTSNDVISREILTRFGKPIATSSANPKGGIAPYSAEESHLQFKNKEYRPSFYLNGGSLFRGNLPSTIIKIEEKTIQVLRKGNFPFKELLVF